MLKTILFIDGSSTSIRLLKEIVKSKKFIIKYIIISKSSNKLIIHKLKKKYKNKISVSNIKSKNLIKKIISLSCDIGFSYYDKKIPIKVINSLKIGGINFHPSFLPYNKGRHSTFFAINQSTPFGASSHWLNEKFDDGDIFTQEKIIFKKFENARIVYNKQIKVLIKVIIKTIKYVSNNKFLRKKQKKVKNDYHFAWDIKKFTNIQFDKKMTNEKLGNLIRSTSYSNNTGFNIIHNSRAYFIVSKYSVKKCNYKKRYLIFIKDIFKNLSKKDKFSFILKVKNFEIKVDSKVSKFIKL